MEINAEQTDRWTDRQNPNNFVSSKWALTDVSAINLLFAYFVDLNSDKLIKYYYYTQNNLIANNILKKCLLF